MINRKALFSLLFSLFITISPIVMAADYCGDFNNDDKVSIADLYLGMKIIDNHGNPSTCPAADRQKLDIGPLSRNESGDLIVDGAGKAQPNPDGKCNDLDLQVIEQIILKKIKLNCAP